MSSSGSYTYWDTTVGNGTVDGGTGTWDSTTANWTTSGGAPNGTWAGGTNTATFQGTAGTVTVSGTQSVGGLTFNTAGYTLTGGTLNLASTTNTLSSASGNTTIGTQITGGASNALSVNTAGSISLTGNNNTYSGGTSVVAGNLTAYTSSSSGLTSLGTGAVAIAAGANLTWDNSSIVGTFDYWQPNPITGTGTFNVMGASIASNYRSILIDITDVNKFSGFTGTINVMSGQVEPKATVTTANFNLSSGAVAVTWTAGGQPTIGALTGSGQWTGFNGYGGGTVTIGNGGGSGTFAGVIRDVYGTMNITKIGSGNQTFTGVNTYQGTTTISGGTLTVDGAGQLGGGTYTGGITNTANFVYNSSANQVIQGAISGTGGTLTKGSSATSVLTLSGANSYTGSTTVNAGTLLINGSQGAATGAVTASGGTLGGSGTIGGATTVWSGATLSPGGNSALAGNGVATLAFSNGLLLNTGSTSAFDLGQAGTAGGALNDLVSVTGNLTLAGNLVVTQSTGGTFGAGTYRLFNYTGTRSGSFSSVTVPAGYVGSVDTSVANQVNLVVVAAGSVTYWDGSNTSANGSPDGGTGTWDGTTTNWTTSGGTPNGSWPGGSATATFQGTGGTVTLASGYSPSVGGITFGTTGYTIATINSAIQLAQNSVISTTVSGLTDTISAPVVGAGGNLYSLTYTPTTNGTLVLSCGNFYNGNITVSTGGTLTIGGAGTLNTGSAATGSYSGTISVGTGTFLRWITLCVLFAVTSLGHADTKSLPINERHTLCQRELQVPVFELTHDDGPDGVIVKIMEGIARDYRCKVRFIVAPLARVEYMYLNGKSDILVTDSEAPEFKAIGTFVPLFQSHLGFIMLRKAGMPTTAEEVLANNQLRVEYLRSEIPSSPSGFGKGVDLYLAKLAKENRLGVYKDTEEGIKKLKANHIDAIFDAPVVLQFIHELDETLDVVYIPTDQKWALGWYVSNKTPPGIDRQLLARLIAQYVHDYGYLRSINAGITDPKLQSTSMELPAMVRTSPQK